MPWFIRIAFIFFFFFLFIIIIISFFCSFFIVNINSVFHTRSEVYLLNIRIWPMMAGRLDIFWSNPAWVRVEFSEYKLLCMYLTLARYSRSFIKRINKYTHRKQTQRKNPRQSWIHKNLFHDNTWDQIFAQIELF